MVIVRNDEIGFPFRRALENAVVIRISRPWGLQHFTPGDVARARIPRPNCGQLKGFDCGAECFPIWQASSYELPR